MIHLGDITQMKPETTPPVDCITFGSPCQDLSVAGKRAGLAKRAARDFLRVSWINTAIVTAAKTDRPYMAVIVYGKY